MTLDPRADRTALRLKLYANGFSPLPNKSKLCLVKEWSTLKVTPELIQSRQWARSNAFLDTGLRCGDIVALDFDIDDGPLLNELLDKIIELNLVEPSDFVRVGRPPRELWVYRTADKIGKRTTGHFALPSAPLDESGYAVEILGAGCQFAAFGQRDAETAYTWWFESPLEHAYMDLPVITLKQVEALKDFCEVFFAGHGLERRSLGGGTDGGYTHVYDLTPDMVFNVKDQGEMSVAELTEALTANPDETWRCSVETFRPTSGSWAGMVSLVNGALCISDHGTYTSHFPEGLDAANGMETLGRLLAERFPEAIPPEPENLKLDPHDAFDDNLAKALKRYIFVGRDGLIFDPQETFQTYDTRAFRAMMAPYNEVKLGPRGAEQFTWLYDMWLKHPSRQTVKDAQMRPDQAGKLIFINDSSLHLNTYNPPVFAAVGGDPAGGLALIEHLLPNPVERAWYLQWLAYKFRYPEVPGPAVVMVAKDTFGTGRGSLVRLFKKLFGETYVQNISFNTLIGKGSQSQYNEFMSESLIVAVDEASENDNATGHWQARSNAYEHLKNIVDPAGDRYIHVLRKSVKNTAARTFATIHIASNHGDALVIPPNDRRFGVLGNGDAPPPEFFAGFHRWLAQPDNVGAFARHLLTVDIAGYNPYTAPPMTAAKADMIDAGASELDKAATLALAGARGGLMVKEQFTVLVEDIMLAEGYEFPEDWQRVAERIFLRKSRRLLGPDRHLVEGKMRSVRIVGPVPDGALSALALMLNEIALNGPLSRPIRTSGTVVSFSGARKSL